MDAQQIYALIVTLSCALALGSPFLVLLILGLCRAAGETDEILGYDE